MTLAVRKTNYGPAVEPLVIKWSNEGGAGWVRATEADIKAAAQAEIEREARAAIAVDVRKNAVSAAKTRINGPNTNNFDVNGGDF